MAWLHTEGKTLTGPRLNPTVMPWLIGHPRMQDVRVFAPSAAPRCLANELRRALSCSHRLMNPRTDVAEFPGRARSTQHRNS